MRHRKAGKKLNRNSSHRKAMFRNMVTSLIKYGKIRTTDAKAKELRQWGDKLVTLAKRGDLHARRQALAIVRERAVVKKLFDEAAERFGKIPGGYTRVIKLGRRTGDAAPMSIVDFVAPEDIKTKKKKKVKKAAVDTKPKESETKTAEKKSDSKNDTPGTGADTSASKKVEEGIDQSAENKAEVESSKPAVESDSADTDGEADNSSDDKTSKE